MSEVNKSVNLTIYEWHRLLDELEYLRCICNRDQDMAIDLWEKIASQLDDKQHIVFGSQKHKILHPELFIKKEEPKEETIKKDEPMKTFWQYLNPFAKQ